MSVTETGTHAREPGPPELAAAIAEEIDRDQDCRPVSPGGVARAASVIGELL